MFPPVRPAFAIKFYTKPDCPLCEQVLALLDELSDHQPLDVQTINILTDSALYGQYRDRIPVLIFPDGAVMGPPIRRDRLMAKLRRISSDAVGGI
ncbi:MAG: glutaredoxin family protein [candidate division Zixibacteria bacterium]|nr:glutaredoxin family protein [candidate division Zixibacteria bacterium]